MTTCIDLKERFGRRFRLLYEESYTTENRRGHDPWLLTIVCRHGHIYPHGRDQLAASTNSRGPIAKRLAALPCVRVVQDGDDGINVVFHIDDFTTVAAIMKPKRRRKLTAEHKAKLTAAGRLALARHRNSGVDCETRRRDPAA
jgi:hypothetical protein